MSYFTSKFTNYNGENEIEFNFEDEFILKSYLTKHTHLSTMNIPQGDGAITWRCKQQHAVKSFKNLYTGYGVEMRLKLLV
jgi:hypothetical protein